MKFDGVITMRTKNIEAKFVMSIPFDRPDENGNIYTREAVKKAICNFKNEKLPIIYRNNETDSKDEVVGTATVSPNVTWDDENRICKVEIDGVIFYGGTGCIVNGMTKNFEIEDYDITCIGLSK